MISISRYLFALLSYLTNFTKKIAKNFEKEKVTPGYGSYLTQLLKVQRII